MLYNAFLIHLVNDSSWYFSHSMAVSKVSFRDLYKFGAHLSRPECWAAKRTNLPLFRGPIREICQSKTPRLFLSLCIPDAKRMVCGCKAGHMPLALRSRSVVGVLSCQLSVYDIIGYSTDKISHFNKAGTRVTVRQRFFRNVSHSKHFSVAFICIDV